MDNRAVTFATKMYNYYYSLAIQEFNHDTSHILAKIPADYVYNEYINNKYCINERCCLKHCIDLLDSEFNVLDPSIKRAAYEKSLNLYAGNTSMSEINMKLKKERKKFQNLYFDSAQKYRDENNLNSLMKNVTIKDNNPNHLLFQNLKLN